VYNGTAYKDPCNQCVGGTTGKQPCKQDCANVWGGTADTDDCGQCISGLKLRSDKPCQPDCDKIKELQDDKAFNDIIKDYINKARTDPLEDGYKLVENGERLYPSKRTEGSISIPSATNYKHTEWLHTHPSSGVPIPSFEDLYELRNFCKNGYMLDDYSFRFVIVTTNGIGVIQVTNAEKFKGSIYVNENGEAIDILQNKKYYRDKYLEILSSDANADGNFQEALNLMFNEFNLGLSYIFGDISNLDYNNEGEIDWKAYGPASNGGFKTKDCD
jgi:hypothetical protein